MAFKNPAFEQSRSSFMQLPLEIRTIILRTLLVHDGPLRARREQKTREPVVWAGIVSARTFVKQYNEQECCLYDLHPAILATCQRVFREGCSLLCDCNTIGMQFNAGGAVIYADPDMNTQDWNEELQALVNTEQANKLLCRFNKVHIDIDCRYVNFLEIKRVILGMGEVLRDKDVQVEFIAPEDDEDTRTQYQYDDPEVIMLDQLEYFQLTRLKSFRILSTLKFHLNPSKVSAIIAVVASDQPIVNLWPSLRNFEIYYAAVSRFLYPDLPEDRHHDYDERGHWLSMENAALQYDAAKFCRVRAEWMKETADKLQEHKMRVFCNDHLHGRE